MRQPSLVTGSVVKVLASSAVPTMAYSHAGDQNASNMRFIFQLGHRIFFSTMKSFTNLSSSKPPHRKIPKVVLHQSSQRAQ